MSFFNFFKRKKQVPDGALLVQFLAEKLEKDLGEPLEIGSIQKSEGLYFITVSLKDEYSHRLFYVTEDANYERLLRAVKDEALEVWSMRDRRKQNMKMAGIKSEH